jgi:hypothetical protein
MIWFSASCNCTSLPNSLGLPAFPLRMISVCGSNMLTNFPENWVTPSKIRSLAGPDFCRFIACRAVGTAAVANQKQI